MTIKKTVQMIALSGVLAIGVSGHAMAKKVDVSLEVTTIPSISGGPVAKDLPGKQGGPVPKGDIVTFKEEVTAVDGTTIEKTLEDIANEQRDIAAIHNALSGIHYIFGKDDKYSVSTSVGFHNSANVALAVGLSGKPADNIMVFGSLSSSASMEHFGANVGVSVAF